MIPAGLATGVFDLPALLFSAGVSVLYLRGAGRRSERVAPRPERTAAFLGGVAVVLLAHLSAIAAWSHELFWVHMLQHLMLTVVAAPLLAWSTPAATVRHALPAGARRVLSGFARRSRRARRSVGNPHPLLLATLTHAATIWLWHTPPLYDAAVRHHGLHLIEHATMLGAAIWFWSEIWSSARRRPRTQALATLCLAAMIAQGAVLGAALTFASRPLFSAYVGHGGLGALEDQQFAGAIMWVPPGVVYAAVAVSRFIGWMHAAERHASPRPSPRARATEPRRFEGSWAERQSSSPAARGNEWTASSDRE